MLARKLVHAAMGLAHVRMERCCNVHELEALGKLLATSAAFGEDVARRKEAQQARLAARKTDGN